MKILKNPNWAIICGAIRLRLEFEITLNAALALKQEGLIEEIVVSTWNDIFKLEPDLHHKLTALGVYVVSVPQIKQGGNGNTYRQHRLLDAALEICPNETAIFKMRSDKCVHRLRFFKDVLKRGLADTPTPNSPFKLFKKRLAVMAASLTIPFSNSDVVFYGLKEDIKTLLHMDMVYDWVFYPGSANAEIRWFSKPFLKSIKMFAAYFEYFNCRMMSQYITDSYAKDTAVEIPDFIHDVMTANLLCLYHNFEIVSDRSEPETLTAKDLYTGRNPSVTRLIPITKAQHILAFNDRVIAAIVNGEMHDDPSNAGIEAALKRLTSEDYLRRDFLPADLWKIQKQTFPDIPYDCSPTSYLRFATNIYYPNTDIQKGELSLSVDFLADLPEKERMFILAYIKDNCATNALEVIFYKLALMYANGDGVPRNKEYELFWMQQGAEGRYRPAQTSFAKLLEAKEDFNNAAWWYYQSAITGDKDAQHALALLLRDHNITKIEADWQEWMGKSTEQAGTENLPQ